MNTKKKGDIAETAILKKLVQKEYRVSIPWGENAPYDLIVDIQGILGRVQCRTGRINDDEKSIEFNLSTTCYSSFEKKSVRKGKSEEIDFYGIYTPKDDCCYLIPKGKITNNQSGYLRLKPFEKGREWMEKKCLWAKDFLI